MVWICDLSGYFPFSYVQNLRDLSLCWILLSVFFFGHLIRFACLPLVTWSNFCWIIFSFDLLFLVMMFSYFDCFFCHVPIFFSYTMFLISYCTFFNGLFLVVVLWSTIILVSYIMLLLIELCCLLLNFGVEVFFWLLYYYLCHLFVLIYPYSVWIVIFCLLWLFVVFWSVLNYCV